MKVPFEEHGSGKPVVLLHAFPLSRKMWQPQIDAIAALNCRIIAPDLRGFGDNHNFSDINTMEDMARDIAELLDILKIERAIIGGLSMGGYVVFNLLRLFPQKFAALILADTNCGADSGEKREGRFDLIEQIESSGASAIIENMLPKLTSDYSKQNNPQLITDLQTTISSINPKGAIAALRGMAERQDHCQLLESINVPVRLTFGEDDKVTDLETARMMNSKIANSNLNIIPNAGHYSNLEQPEEFNKILKDFIDSVEI